MIDRMHSIRVVDHFHLCLLYPGFKSCFERIFPIQFSASSCGQTRVLIYWRGKSAVHKVTPYPKNPKNSIGCRVVANITYTSSSSKLGVTERHFCSNLLNYSVNMLLNKIVC